ncbi:MAG: hypothetical protein AAGA99_20560 [Actinomycetota bacterium]
MSFSRPRRVVAVVVAMSLAALGSVVPAVAQTDPVVLTDESTWLEVVNHHRQASGLEPITEEATWTPGIFEHLRYLELTPAALQTGEYANAHRQNPASPWATPAGAIAGRSSNIGGGPTDRAAIESWLTGPFHAIGLLRPGWRTGAFGRDPSTARAMLDVLQGLDFSPIEQPVLFPGDGAITSLRSYDGTESPDPLESCPGFEAPTGLPILALLPSSPSVQTTARLTLPDGSRVDEGDDLCVYTAATYRTSDSIHGAVGGQILDGANAVVIIPRRPLADGPHTVELFAPGVAVLDWTFTAADASVAGGASLPALGGDGYLLVDVDGRVTAFGDAPALGSETGTSPGVDVAATPTGQGYWVLRADGTIETRGDAASHPVSSTLRRGELAAAITATPSGDGYWIFTSFGRVLAGGDAAHFGDMDGTVLNGPVLDGVATPTGRGYYLVASDGGVFTFGDAVFRGSMGSTPLNAPVRSLAPDPDGDGYWLVADDGGIFAFDAEFIGSMADARLNGPIVGIVARGDGYTLVGSDGGVFSFGAPFFGSLGALGADRPIVSITPVG